MTLRRPQDLRTVREYRDELALDFCSRRNHTRISHDGSSGFPGAASRSDGLLGVPSSRIRCGNQCSETRGPQGGGDCSADASIPIGSTRRDYSDAEVETIAEW